jgi:hypothetical protein
MFLLVGGIDSTRGRINIMSRRAGAMASGGGGFKHDLEDR